MPRPHAASRRSCARRGLRPEVDDRTESIGRKIRDAELRKIPYMLVIGDREAESGSVAVREHGGGDTGSVPTRGVRDAAVDTNRTTFRLTPAYTAAR